MSILDSLTPKQRQKAEQKRFSKGEVLFREGDICSGISILIEGNIKIASVSLQGKEIIFNHVGPGQMFGNNLLFASDRRYRGNVIALTSGRLAAIKEEDLVILLQENADFLKEYLRIQSDFGKGLNSRIKILSLESPLERLVFYLHSQGGKVANMKVTELAEQIDVRRETMSRLLTSMEKDGLIAREKGIISLTQKAETEN